MCESAQVSEKEAQRKELEQRLEQLEARLAPLDADKAELAGRVNGLEKRLREGTSPFTSPHAFLFHICLGRMVCAKSLETSCAGKVWKMIFFAPIIR